MCCYPHDLNSFTVLEWDDTSIYTAPDKQFHMVYLRLFSSFVILSRIAIAVVMELQMFKRFKLL